MCSMKLTFHTVSVLLENFFSRQLMLFGLSTYYSVCGQIYNLIKLDNLIKSRVNMALCLSQYSWSDPNTQAFDQDGVQFPEIIYLYMFQQFYNDLCTGFQHPSPNRAAIQCAVLHNFHPPPFPTSSAYVIIGNLIHLNYVNFCDFKDNND